MLRWRDRVFSRPVIIAAVVMCLYDFLVVLPTKFITYAWPSAPIQFFRTPTGLVAMYEGNRPSATSPTLTPARDSSWVSLPGIRTSYCFWEPGGAWHATETPLRVTLSNNFEQLTADEFAQLRSVATGAMETAKLDVHGSQSDQLAANASSILLVLHDGEESVTTRQIRITKTIPRPSGYILNALSLAAWPICITAAARRSRDLLRSLRGARRIHRGLCPNCSYDRRNGLGRPCPECGTPPIASSTHSTTDSAQTAGHALPRDGTRRTTQ